MNKYEAVNTKVAKIFKEEDWVDAIISKLKE